MNFAILVCLVSSVAFGEAMPQAKLGRKVHILGRPGDHGVAIRDRTVIPDAPVLDEETKVVDINQAPVQIPVNEVKQVNAERRKTPDEEAALFKKQAESAKYSFDSSIDDGINDNQHTRTEVRDGLNVVGMYSYSDGFFRRTVHYEADDKGYRVVKEETEPIGDGPIVNLDGEAIVRSSLGSEYKITIDDIQEIEKKRAKKLS